MADPAISYTPRADAAPEVELAALAAIYKLCISSHAHRHARSVTSTTGDDAKERSEDDSSAKTRIP
jgi:hypothetical protein